MDELVDIIGPKQGSNLPHVLLVKIIVQAINSFLRKKSKVVVVQQVLATPKILRDTLLPANNLVLGRAHKKIRGLALRLEEVEAHGRDAPADLLEEEVIRIHEFTHRIEPVIVADKQIDRHDLSKREKGGWLF